VAATKGKEGEVEIKGRQGISAQMTMNWAVLNEYRPELTDVQTELVNQIEKWIEQKKTYSEPEANARGIAPGAVGINN
jgi:hypothetical protein